MLNASKANSEQVSATATSQAGQQTQSAQSAASAAATPEKTKVPTKQSKPISTVSTKGPYGGTLALSDPLSSNNYGWQDFTDPNTGNSCHFLGGAYHVVAAGGGNTSGTCFAQKTDFTNFAYQVQMSFVKVGTKFSGGGIAFRGDSATSKYYYFEVFESGRYDFTGCFGPGKANCTYQIIGYPKQTGIVPAFNPVMGQPNTVAVVANGTTFDIYVNGQHAIGPITDSTFSHGMIGVYATGGIDPGVSQTAEVTFSNAKVWRL